jgi:transcriptional regulator with XRE-family HTH domain
MADLTNIGIDTSKLRKARDKSGLSQSEVAESVGVQKAAISKIECGRALPSADLLARLCKLYEIDIANVTGRRIAA